MTSELANRLARTRAVATEQFANDLKEFNPTDRTAFAQIIAEACDFHGLNQACLADEFEVSLATVNRWARGATAPIKPARKAVVDRIVELLRTNRFEIERVARVQGHRKSVEAVAEIARTGIATQEDS